MPKPICSLVNFFGLFRLLLGLGSFLDPLFTLRHTAFNRWSSSGLLINHRTLNLLLLQHLRRDAKLINPDDKKCQKYVSHRCFADKPGRVHLVDVALVEEDEEDHVVPEQMSKLIFLPKLSKNDT